MDSSQEYTPTDRYCIHNQILKRTARKETLSITTRTNAYRLGVRVHHRPPPPHRCRYPSSLLYAGQMVLLEARY